MADGTAHYAEKVGDAQQLIKLGLKSNDLSLSFQHNYGWLCFTGDLPLVVEVKIVLIFILERKKYYQIS